MNADENNAMIHNPRQEYISIRIVSIPHSYLIRNLPQGPFYPRPNFEKYQKSSADENNAMIHNPRQEYISIRIVSVPHSYLIVSKVSFRSRPKSCGLVRFHSGCYL